MFILSVGKLFFFVRSGIRNRSTGEKNPLAFPGVIVIKRKLQVFSTDLNARRSWRQINRNISFRRGTIKGLQFPHRVLESFLTRRCTERREKKKERKETKRKSAKASLNASGFLFGMMKFQSRISSKSIVASNTRTCPTENNELDGWLNLKSALKVSMFLVSLFIKHSSADECL